MSKLQKGDEDIIRECLDKDTLNNWLSQFGDDQIVGVAKNTDRRPLARFVRERTGQKEVVITPVRTHVGNAHVTNPPWMIAFIEEIDTLRKNKITAGDAIEVLNNLGHKPGDPL